MSEQLGKVEKPLAKEYKEGRKLYFVPLVFAPKEPQDDFKEIVSKYWSQAQSHLSDLEAKLGQPNKVFHELIPIGGKDGVKAIEELNKDSYSLIKTRLDKGAILEAMEENDLLAEFMDWTKCLSVTLQSQKVFNKVYEFYIDVQERRNKYIEKKIDDGLKDNDIGILIMREGHQIQFPSDLQVFYVRPPALDEINRWLREHGNIST
jgi:hypothetical protein